MKEPIILIGGGGHCKACIDVIERGEEFYIAGILDIHEKVGERILGYEIIGIDDDFAELSHSFSNYLITVGQIKSAIKRIRLYDMVKAGGGRLPAIISPNAYVAESAIIGEGTIIMHNVTINAEARIGINCILNSKALVEHEAVIGDFCHISTGAIVNGQTKVGNSCFVGSNAVLANNISISDEIVISAGSRILEDLNIPGIYSDNKRI